MNNLIRKGENTRIQKQYFVENLNNMTPSHFGIPVLKNIKNCRNIFLFQLITGRRGIPNYYVIERLYSFCKSIS